MTPDIFRGEELSIFRRVTINVEPSGGRVKRSLQVTQHGGSDVLKITVSPEEQIQDYSVRIKVHAAGINFADIMMRMGLYPEAPKPPFTPGYEVAGEVTEIGAGVTAFRVGDRVLTLTNFGGYTSEIVAEYYSLYKIPEHLSYAEAAAIPVNFLTGWIVLKEMARVHAGDRVLIPSAAGGVGLAAVQIAHQEGAHVVGLVSSLTKSGIVQSLGADEVWTNERWHESDDGDAGEFDIILDSVGGESLRRSYKRLAPAGRVVSFGVSSMVQRERRSVLKALSVIIQSPLFTPISLMNNNRGVFGLNLLPLCQATAQDPQSMVHRSLSKILRGFHEKRYRTVIGRTYPLAEGGAAHDYLQSRANIGKVVLTCQENESFRSSSETFV